MKPMQKEFNEILDFCRQLVASIEKSANSIQQQIPIFVTNQIRGINKQNAASGLGISEETLFQYLSAINVDIKGSGVVVIELSPDPWLPNAIESGAKPWNMIDTHLRSNYKVSKQGYRYKVLPMKAGKNSGTFMNPTTGKREPNRDYTQRAKEIREDVNKALKAPKWKAVRTSPLKNTGQVQKLSKLDTKNDAFPKLKEFNSLGLYKVETFKDSAHAASGSPPSKKPQYLMFRTITDNPAKSSGLWNHPGILPRDIFTKLDNSLQRDLSKYIDDIIEAEFSWIE
jgi:hypothetical protein